MLAGSFIGAAILGYLLFSGPTGAVAQSALSFTWGFVVSGILYMNLAGYQIKAVRTSLAGRATGIFVTTLYGAGAGYIMGGFAAHAGWSNAGLIQITLVSVIGVMLSLTLQPERMALPTARGKR